MKELFDKYSAVTINHPINEHNHRLVSGMFIFALHQKGDIKSAVMLLLLKSNNN